MGLRFSGLGFRGSRVVVSEFWSPVLRSMILDPGQFVDKVPIPMPPRLPPPP